MLALSEVTLACVDTLNPALALRALERSRKDIRFARTLLLTHDIPDVVLSDGVETLRIDPLPSRDAYSQFVLKRLLPYVDTAHVLLVQWDGYVIHPQAWDDAFAGVDYLGARWFWQTDGHDVGNGGFSLRSRKLLVALQDPAITLVGNEDETIGRSFRTHLEREHGIRFGDATMADRFAFEAAYPVGRPFGFHGLYNFCRVMPPAELTALCTVFTPAILRSPQLAQLLRNCVALGQWQPAIAIARRMLEVDGSNAQAATLLAQSESALARGAGIGRNDPCPCGSGRRYKQCHGAVSLGAPAELTADDQVARGLEAHQRGDLATAAREYQAALARAPEHPYALHYLGVIEYQQGRAAQALPMLERAAAAHPGESEFHNNLGLVLAALERDADAVDAHRRAVLRKPDHAGAWNNLGLALRACNDLDGAIAAFDRALALAPDFTQAQWNRALALLHAGRFAEGWRAYETRLSIPAFAAASQPATPRWDGSDPAGRTILLVAEQGLGDAIQFVRLAAPLAARGARVVLQCAPSLVDVLKTAQGVSAVAGFDAPAPPHDAWLPLLSLAGVLGIDDTNIPAQVPYLRADASLVRDVARTFRQHVVPLSIGVAWTGNRANTNDRRRSLPLSMLVPLFDLPGVRWYSLQKGDGDDPQNRAGDLARLVRLPWRESFDGLAAMMTQLDLVVSVDTSVAHLGGALARPVVLLLPYMSDWRWRRDRSDSDWYPTATLIRQPASGDWAGVVTRLREVLQARLREPR